MSTCTVINQNTKEPKLYYKSDRGTIHEALPQVLQNSDNSFQVGFKDAMEDFSPRGTFPIHSTDTIEGTVQAFIKNEFLKPGKINENVYEAVDTVAADLLEETLIVSNPDQYERNGDIFTFGDFRITPESTTNKTVSGIIQVFDKIQELRNKPKNKPVNFKKEQLSGMIRSFMEELGFSFQAIESFKGRTDGNPDALIQFSKKIVAISQGEDVLDNLSEEFSHFIVEAWDQEEVRRLLQSIHNTAEYAQYAEQYRQIYSNQITDPVKLEEVVRREVLGKMLATSLQSQFTEENRTDLEKSFFSKIRQLLTDFFKFIQSKINPTLQQQIDMMAREVGNRLYNENLSERLSDNVDPLVDIMYSAQQVDGGQMRELYKKIQSETAFANSNLEREIFNSTSGILLSASSVYTNLNNKKSDEVVDTGTQNAIERLRGVQEYLSLINNYLNQIKVADISQAYISRYEQKQGVKPSAAEVASETNRIINFKKSIKDKTERIAIYMSMIEGIYQGGTVDTIQIAEALEEALGNSSTQEERDARIHHVNYGVMAEQKDTGWFWKNFGHVPKSSNLFVAMAGSLISKSHKEYLMGFNNDIERLVKKIEPYRNMLPEFVVNGIYRFGGKAEMIKKARLQYQLDILAKVTPEMTAKYSGMSIEDFERMVEDTGIEELKDSKSEEYFKYEYLYRKELPNQDFVDDETKKKEKIFIENMEKVIIGQDVWGSQLFRDRVLESKGRPADITQRREYSNILTSTGTVKDGFELIEYGEVAKNPSKYPDINNLVSPNPNHTFTPGSSDIPQPTDIVAYFDAKNMTQADVSGQIAFQYLKWGQMIKENEKSAQNNVVGAKSTRDVIHGNFAKAYDEKKKILDFEGITEKDKPVERRKALLEFIENSMLFENSPEYWLEFQDNAAGIDFDIYFKEVTDKTEVAEMEALRKEFAILRMSRNLLMKKFKSRYDYKEIDVASLRDVDKQEIRNKEEEISRKRKEIYNKFVLANLKEEMYKDGGTQSVVRLNKGAKDEIVIKTGKSFEEATIEDLEKFFLADNNLMNTHAYQKVKDETDINADSLKTLREDAAAMGFSDDKEGITRAFFVNGAQSWFKRYDAMSAYDKFMTDLYAEKINVENMLDTFVANNGASGIHYIDENGKPQNLDKMVLSPSYRFIAPFEPNIEYLVKQYIAPGTSDERKLEIISEANGVENIPAKYRDDMSDILNNPEKKKAFLLMWEIQMTRLYKDFANDKNKKLTQRHVAILPQVRRTSYERIHKLFGGKFKAGEIGDWITEAYAFREDDMEESYKDSVIPMYGYYMLTNEERTDDIFHSLVWGLKNANRRHQRVRYYDKVKAAMTALENQNFGKIDAKNTNYWRMMQDTIDHNFFGRTTTFSYKFTIPMERFGMSNIDIDLGKVASGFRILSVKTALAFSPITAMTNFSSGVMQNFMMSAVGHDIYGPANLRALGVLGRIVGGSIRDIGEFDPTSKVNKIFYSFGYHDMEERFRDARYSKGIRLLDGIGFAPMAVTNYPLEVQSILTKLTEYRLIDGEFIDWKTFKKRQATLKPGVKESEIKSNFNKANKQSAYDFLDENGQFDEVKLEKAGYKGVILNDKTRMMEAISDITERTTMEIRDINEAGGLRNPLMAFFISMKKWMVLATSAMTARSRFNYGSLSEEKGMLASLGSLPEMVVDYIKKKEKFQDSWEQVSDIDKLNLKRAWISSSMILGAFTLAMLLKGWADDDDEEDNYLAQMAAYMALRNLNELSSSQLGIGQSYFESISAPIMAASTLKSGFKLLDFENIGDEVQTGKYQGSDKYAASIIKATSLKNLYTMGWIPMGDNTGAEILKQTRTSYLHFNTNDSLYSVLSLIPSKEKE